MRVPTGPTAPSLCVVSSPPHSTGIPVPAPRGKSAAPRGPEACPVLPGSSLPGSGSCLHLPHPSASVSPRLGSPAPPAWPSAGVMLLGGGKPPPCATGERAAPKIAPGVRAQPTPSCSAHPPRTPPAGSGRHRPGRGRGGPHTPPCMGGPGHRASFGVFSRQTVLLCRCRLVLPAMAPALGGGVWGDGPGCPRHGVLGGFWELRVVPCQGEKNHGFDVLYHNMKHGQISTKELADFVRERYWGGRGGATRGVPASPDSVPSAPSPLSPGPPSRRTTPKPW